MTEPHYRILMVDDVVRYHRLYEMAITDALPAKVAFAADGAEALEKLKSPVPFDLLILDLNMPRLGGEETLLRIRQDPNFDNMPVIILTGDTDLETHRRLLDLGADDFVEKGSPPEIFVARLKTQIRHKQALDQLTRLAVDMDIFAAGVLHDIRNVETNVLTVCELARVYLDEDPKGRAELMIQDLTALEDRAEALGKYAAEIIHMVRETHKPLSPKPQAIEPLIDWAVRIAAPKNSDVKSDQKLTWRAEGPLAPVLADKHFLQLALLNLVQNAYKYRRPGSSAEVVVSQREGPGGDKKSRVTCLQDNGIGIRKSELRRVFEPFTRGTSLTKGASGGYGLGLAMVQKVVTSMGGSVWAEVPVGEVGTVMCVELPTPTPDACDHSAKASPGR